MKKSFKFPSLSSSPCCTLASMIDSVRFRWFCYVRFRYVHFRFRCVHFRFRCVHFRFRYVHFRMRERRSRSFAVWWSVDRSTTWKRSCVANPLHQNQVGFWKIFVYFVNNCFSFPRKIVSGLILAHNFSFYHCKWSKRCSDRLSGYFSVFGLKAASLVFYSDLKRTAWCYHFYLLSP